MPNAIITDLDVALLQHVEVVVTTTDVASASVIDTYRPEGSPGRRSFTIQGRGTRAQRHDNGDFRMIHQHLIHFPRPN